MARRPGSVLLASVLLAAVLVAPATDASAADAGGDTARRPGRVLGPATVTVRLGIRYSGFHPERIVVRPGTTVRFEVRNRDPIGHELIVGPPQIHALHEAGTGHEHAGGGEVSVAPGATGSTVYRFDQPGPVVFACHLPGHLAYGMSGEVVVRAARSGT